MQPLKDATMTKKLIKILALTILTLTSASCSMALLNDEESSLNGEFTISVNGIVSDVETNEPLKGIKVTFSAYEENSISVIPLITRSVYTNPLGIYSFKVKGFSEPVTCEIKAECEDYETMTNKIVVTWTGNSFDPEENTFYVNDCNFQMKKN